MSPSNQSQIIEEAKFIYSPLRKALEKKREKKKMQLKNKQKQLTVDSKKNTRYRSQK